MNTKIKNTGLIIGLLFLFTFCDDNIDPLIEELQVDRVFSPIDLSAKIRNMVTAELSWDLRDDASSYLLEISDDSLEFSNIIHTATVAPDDLPYSITLEGETQYSARVKGVSESGLADSKWTAIAFKTDPENIFYSLEDNDYDANWVTLKWPAGSEVDKFIIVPGNTEREITQEEKDAGTATITGLTGETEYTIKMMRNTKQRGAVTFTTLIDVGDATRVYPEDDLGAAIAAAEEGETLVLLPGEYLAYSGTISLDKSISVKGLYPYDKPIVHVAFELKDAAQTLNLVNLEMNGNYTDTETGEKSMLSSAIQYGTSDVAFGSLVIQGCYIHNFSKSLISDGGEAFEAASILVDDCIVTDILNDGGDFIDSRKSYFARLTVQNSTFSNCATVSTRDFIRMDGSTKGNTYDDGTRSPEIAVINCTLHNVMNSTSSTKRLFYVRWSQHTIESKNNLFVDMGVSVYSNQSLTLQPECSFNNYFNADGYITAEAGVLTDNSGNYTTLDPGFTDPANGVFTVTNQTLLDNQVGDPRWLTGQ